MNKKDYYEPHTFKGYLMTALAIIKLRFSRLFLSALILASSIIPLLPQHIAKADALDLYWFGGSGNFTDPAHWGTSTNGTGAPHAKPTSTNNVFFDVNSFTAPGQVVTVNETSTANSMNWTGATNTPTLAGASTLTISGNAVFISNMTVTFSSIIFFAGGGSIISNGANLSTVILRPSTGKTLTILDNLTAQTISTGNNHEVVITNNHTIVSAFSISGTATNLQLGSSTINATSWTVNEAGATNITANTATINILGTGAVGFDTANYSGATFNLVGTSHSLTGSPTGLTALNLLSTATQTITFAGGTTIPANSFSLSGSSGHQHTLQSSNTTNWNISVTSGNITADYITISRSTANTTGGQAYYAVGGSVDGGNNIGWQFPLTISTLSASNISMTKDGVTSGNFSGSITDMGGQSTVNAWHDYGLTASYGSTTSNVTYSTTNFTGTKYQSISNNLTPGQTYHTRYSITSGANTTQGSDSTFTLTLPSVTTGTPTNVGMNGGTHATLNAEITSMGVATDTYTSFQYSTDLSFSQSTPEVVQGAIGTYSATITGFLPNQFYNVRAVNRVGSVYSYGTTQTFFTNATATFNLLDTTIILVVVALILFILSMMLLPAETPFIFRMILIAVATYFVLAILPGLQNILSALQ